MSVRMCRMVVPIFMLVYRDFFCPDVPPLQLGQPQQKIGDVNQHLMNVRLQKYHFDDLRMDTDTSVSNTKKMLVVCNTFHGHALPFVGTNMVPLQQPPFI